MDKYEADGDADENDYENMDVLQRRLAEYKMKRRDKEEARRNGREGYMDDGTIFKQFNLTYMLQQSNSIDDDEIDLPMLQRRRRRNDMDPELELEDDATVGVNLLSF